MPKCFLFLSSALFTFLIFLIPSLALGTNYNSDSGNQPPAPNPKVQSLEQALNPDGTLKAGVEGSFDPSGFQMTYDKNGKPVFRAGPGDGRWENGFGYGGISWETGYPKIKAIAVSGNDVYVGGEFAYAGGVPQAINIAKWDGSSWSALGPGLGGMVHAIAVVGTDVYAGGEFGNAGGDPNADNIAKWDGSTWSALGSGPNGFVYALAASGTDLYVGGSFFAVGNIATSCIAKWDGSAWSAMGSGLNNLVRAIAVSGTDVFVGGDFTDAGGNPNADYIAKWNGTSWSALGTGLVSGNVFAIAIAGTDVYVAGSFIDAGGIPAADRVARWNGSAWFALGNGVESTAYSITVSGSDVYVGGVFANASGVAGTSNLAKWNGSAWEPASTGIMAAIYAIAFQGADFYIGGTFHYIEGKDNVVHIAKWSNNTWNGLFTSGLNGLSASVGAITISGNDVYVGGSFRNAGGIEDADHIARWDGSSWHAVGGGLNGPVRAIVISGTDIYVGGHFINAGNIPAADHIAKWNGSSWSAIGNGLNNFVYTIVLHGNDLFVGGRFTDAGGIADADYIARWDGTNWHNLGPRLLNNVHAMVMVGTDLYVGGVFQDAGWNLNADFVARWDGTSWHSLGTGLRGPVNALATDGTNLYVGGVFYNAGGITGASYMVKWNGSSWSSFGNNLFSGNVTAITVSGQNIFVGGFFNTNRNHFIAKWDGSGWRMLGSGVDGTVNSIVVSGTKVYVGGGFNGLTDKSKAVSRFGIYNDVNTGPVITSNGAGTSAAISLPENTVAVTTVQATDAEGDAMIYSIAGGADSTKFNINPATGHLTFLTAPDFEAPSDADGNNTYIVVIRASDGFLTANQTITVTITDADEIAPIPAIASTVNSPTVISPIPITVDFNENVTGFTAGDITISNGSIDNFAGTGAAYTFDLIPAGNGLVTINIPAAVAFDSAGNGNVAAVPFNIVFNGVTGNNEVEISSSSKIAIYPNPNKGTIYIQLKEVMVPEVELIISDLTGKKIIQKNLRTLNGNLNEILNLNAAAGVYLLQINADKQFNRRLIIE